MMRTTLACAGMACSVAAGTASGQALERLGNAIFVEPVSVAPVVVRGGAIEVVGEWMAYAGGAGRAVSDRVFSAFGDCDDDGVPDDCGGCGLGGSRWFFGTAYCSAFQTDDFNVDECADLGEDIGRADFAWYWTCDGFGTEECIVAIWTEDSNANECELDSFDYSGWALNFGFLSCNPGGYYYANVDISSVGVWAMPTGGSGSYPLAFLTDSGAALATCAQPMLWGAPNAAGGEPDGPGSAGPGILIDGNGDGTHTSAECTDLILGVCPDPLQVMMQFWGALDPDCDDRCPDADCNGDGAVDTQDFLCFLNHWAAGDIEADCDGNGLVNTQDFLCFLNIWAACRG